MKRTDMYERHVAAGGRMVDYSGWELPVQYDGTGIKTEHLAVREKAGLFDVSHMGEIMAEGPDAEKWLSTLVTNNIFLMKDYQVQYNIMCNDAGGVVDDLLVYRYNPEKFLLVVNAANVDKDWEWLKKHLPVKGVTIDNISMKTSETALQGPAAEAILAKVADFDPSTLKFFTFTDKADLNGIPAIVSRTGYTGEDGFEIYVPWERGAELWDLLIEAGRDFGLIPIGLGARDSLRFEAGLPLYGHEYSEDLGPLEAGFGFFVKADKPGGFIGQPVLKRQKEEGLRRKIVGLRLEDKGVPRSGMDVADASGNRVGKVTSGGYCPSLDANMALCLVKTPAPEEGEHLSVLIREKPKKGTVVKRPFYDRKSGKR